MKNLFSIGQVAKLFRINIRTLRYYDQIGLSISMEDLRKEKYDLFSGIFLIFEEGDRPQYSVTSLTGGNYVTVRL